MQSNQIDSLFFPTQFFSGHKKPKQAWIFSLSQKLPPSDFRPRRRVGGRTGATSPCFTKKQYWDRCSTCFVPWWRPHLGNSHLFFFGNTHTRKTHDFWTFGQNVWPAKYPRKSADHHHPEGACSFVPATAGNRRNGSNIPSLELSRFSAAIDLFDLLSKQIETKSGSKKSPTVGPTERTPKKPEYLKSLATYLGVRWEGPIQFLMGRRNDGGFQVRFISFFHGGRAVLFREGNLKANCYSNPQGNQAIHGFQSMRCGPRVMVSSYHIHDSSECVCQSHLLRGFFWGLYKRQTGYYHKPLFLDPVLKQPCSNSWRVFWTPGFQLVVQLTWNHQPWKPAVKSHLFWSSGGKHLNKLHHFFVGSLLHPICWSNVHHLPICRLEKIQYLNPPYRVVGSFLHPSDKYARARLDEFLKDQGNKII